MTRKVKKMMNREKVLEIQLEAEKDKNIAIVLWGAFTSIILIFIACIAGYSSGKQDGFVDGYAASESQWTMIRFRRANSDEEDMAEMDKMERREASEDDE